MNEKARLRSLMLERRDKANDRMAHSAAIGRHVTSLPEYAAAETISWFVGVKSEVMTLPMIADALSARRRVALPWVSPDGLCLALVGSLEEVAPASFGLLEPRDDIPDRALSLPEMDGAGLVGEDLDLHVAGLLDELLEIHARVAERLERFARRRLEGAGQLLGGAHHAHPLPA